VVRQRPLLVNGNQVPHVTRVRPREYLQADRSHHHTAAIARWENEGGAPTAFEKLKLEKAIAEEEKMLEYLGAAVIMCWGALPTKIQRELFEYATSLTGRGGTDRLKGQIARFLHNHKDEGVRMTTPREYVR
jgi:hypothetical protein